MKRIICEFTFNIPKDYSGVVLHPYFSLISFVENGKLHRHNGPAQHCFAGASTWSIDGIEYLEEDYWKISQKNL